MLLWLLMTTIFFSRFFPFGTRNYLGKNLTPKLLDGTGRQEDCPPTDDL
jgi:hypothetical protein